jgi:hypothetical protein
VPRMSLNPSSLRLAQSDPNSLQALGLPYGWVVLLNSHPCKAPLLHVYRGLREEPLSEPASCLSKPLLANPHVSIAGTLMGPVPLPPLSAASLWRADGMDLSPVWLGLVRAASGLGAVARTGDESSTPSSLPRSLTALAKPPINVSDPFTQQAADLVSVLAGPRREKGGIALSLALPWDERGGLGFHRVAVEDHRREGEVSAAMSRGLHQRPQVRCFPATSLRGIRDAVWEDDVVQRVAMEDGLVYHETRTVC